MGEDEDARLQAEIELLEAMYPDNVSYNAKPRELKYSSDEGSFVLRLPSGYLDDELPEVLSASIGKTGIRAQIKQQVKASNAGEEVLDSIIAGFIDLAAASQATDLTTSASGDPDADEALSTSTTNASTTIIIWLHHLLNINKRKLALSPPAPAGQPAGPPGSQQGKVSGITKPGYPGVLIYSGPSALVHEHVAELKAQNWAAFQIRLESDELWFFSHGEGVREVEMMGEVVAGVGEERKADFLEAMRMK